MKRSFLGNVINDIIIKSITKQQRSGDANFVTLGAVRTQCEPTHCSQPEQPRQPEEKKHHLSHNISPHLRSMLLSNNLILQDASVGHSVGAKYFIPISQPSHDALAALYTGTDPSAAFDAGRNPHAKISEIMNLSIT